MKKINLRLVAVFLFAGLGGAALLYISQNVQKAEDHLAHIRSSMQQERDHIRVLEAEWSYLNSPQNLEVLTEEYLDLAPPAASAVTDAPSNFLPKKEKSVLQPVLMREAP